MEVPVLKSAIRKKILQITLLVILFALTFWSVFRGEDFHEVLLFLRTADLKFIIPSILCVFMFIGSEAIIIHYLLGKMGKRIRMSHCWLYSFTGFFYSAITPSASGGQPMQILAMRKDDIPVPVSTVALAVIAITFKLVLVVIGIFVLTIRPEPIMAHIAHVEGFMYLGLAINVICIAGLFMLVFLPNQIKSIINLLMGIVSRIRPFKHPEKVSEFLDRLFSQYSGAAEFYRNNKHVILNVFIITFLQRCAQFLITWFTYCAFHLTAEAPATVVTLQSMISVASDVIPLPGGMGVNENMFVEIFRNVFGDDRVLPAMVISRGISHYTQMIICGVMTMASVFIIKDKTNIHESLS
ncbi:MAG: flippase-like domain-containing protein [Clostridia bacterium]|nr:flippase-like domain-containing protein [Clostridia bacterium]